MRIKVETYPVAHCPINQGAGIMNPRLVEDLPSWIAGGSIESGSGDILISMLPLSTGKGQFSG